MRVTFLSLTGCDSTCIRHVCCGLVRTGQCVYLVVLNINHDPLISPLAAGNTYLYHVQRNLTHGMDSTRYPISKLAL